MELMYINVVNAVSLKTITANGSQVYLVADLNAQTIKIAIT
jgi:hypothetical protein